MLAEPVVVWNVSDPGAVKLKALVRVVPLLIWRDPSVTGARMLIVRFADWSALKIAVASTALGTVPSTQTFASDQVPAFVAGFQVSAMAAGAVNATPASAAIRMSCRFDLNVCMPSSEQ